MQPDTTAAEIIEATAKLVSRIARLGRSRQSPVTIYRLFEVTRTHAPTKPRQSSARLRVARAHAEYYCSALEEAQRSIRKPCQLRNGCSATGSCSTMCGRHWNGHSRPQSRSRDAMANHAWSRSALVRAVAHEQCADRIDRAPEHRLFQSQHADRDAPSRHPRLVTDADAGALPATQDAWTRVLKISKELGDVDYQLRALWGLWSGLLNRNEFRAALQFARALFPAR